MDSQERLNHLPKEIITSFSSDFVYLVSGDRIQHFPAREWDTAKYLSMLEEKAGEYDLMEWQGNVVAIANHSELIVIMPKFTTISQLKEDYFS